MPTPLTPGILFQDVIPDVQPMTGRPKTTIGEKTLIGLLMALLGTGGLVPPAAGMGIYGYTAGKGVRKSREQERRREALRRGVKRISS